MLSGRRRVGKHKMVLQLGDLSLRLLEPGLPKNGQPIFRMSRGRRQLPAIELFRQSSQRIYPTCGYAIFLSMIPLFGRALQKWG